MSSKKQDKLRQLKKRVTGGSAKGSVVTDMFLLAKEISCLPELIGREYEFIFDKEGKVIGFRQKPMKIPQFIALMDELDKYKKEEAKQMKKGKRKGKKK